MKKLVASIVFLTLVAFSLSSVGAISTDFKQSYSPGETVVAKISGNILEPITPEQIIFKRSNVLVPLAHDVKRVGNDYFFWVIMPSSEQNYTITIENIVATNMGNVEKMDIVKNFSVIGNLTDYNIEPGVIFTKEDFEIGVNLNRDEPMSITTDFPTKRNIELSPGKNTVKYSIDNVVGTEIAFIQLGKYVVPAYILGKKGGVSNSPLSISPEFIDDLILINNYDRPHRFTIKNIGRKDVRKISFVYSKDLFSTTLNNEYDLAPGAEIAFNISLKNKDTKIIRDVMYIQSEVDNVTLALPIYINLTENATEIIRNGGSQNGSSNKYNCEQLSGSKCTSTEICSGESVSASDGSCCLGKCNSTEKSSKAWIGYLIASIVIVGGLYVYFRYTGKKQYVNPVSKKVNELERNIP